MQSMGGAEEHLERKGQLFGRSLDATDAEAPPSNAVSCSEDRRRCWRPSPRSERSTAHGIVWR